jgi:hypothetical protein
MIFRSGGRTRLRARTGIRGGRARSWWPSGGASVSGLNPARGTRWSTAGPVDAGTVGTRRRTMPVTESSAEDAPGQKIGSSSMAQSAGTARARRAPGRRVGTGRSTLCRNRNRDLGGLHREAGMGGGQESPGSVRNNSLLLNLGKVQRRYAASRRRLSLAPVVSSHIVFICWQWAI